MPSLDELTTQHETLFFTHFDAQDAFDLGCIIRSRILSAFPETPVSIRITLPTGQILFTTVTVGGSTLDSESWLTRKAATVLRYGCSTLYMREKMVAKGLAGDRLSEMAPLDDAVYAVHGGGFPVRIRGVDGVAAVIVVSGLKQVDDHDYLVEGVKWFLEKDQRATYLEYPTVKETYPNTVDTYTFQVSVFEL
ncbi:hypothetical protein BZA05DRAFT_415523 [Tricharina praecox]|uniref:uncharacterized protein n=1 Tax=Tricharina praecox TaxID=43433 RepID=UPI002220577E|nr:uncharacterized protein BZA05DRAFT_419117 [Tricharina praecox]XP_051342766.1 uncharacterized protein BZA05DRAFT_415523 [Tricharina praecox]KAI5850590.1 hypothetical protein BZA05DRAFT_419117 [Tricharina praecox]KAI5856796.1 hypothetical protein BZA05DRAFT_415523 [Tricharina praecox]